MEDILKCENIEEVKEILKKIKKDNYDAFINDPKKKDFVFSQIELYNFMEQNIKEQEEKLENIKKHKYELEKQIYSMTNLYVRDIKEFSHDE